MQVLFDLIYSLNAKEKAYLKQHALNPKSNQIRLFNTINQLLKKQEAEGEELPLDDLIKKKHAKDNFIKQLSATKNKLYRQLLKTLRLFYANQAKRSIQTQLTEELEFVTILYRKGIYKGVEKELKRVKAIAEKYERFPELLQMVALERELLIELKDKDLIKEMEALNAEEAHLMERWQVQQQLRRLEFTVKAALRTKQFESEEAQQVLLDKLLEEPLLQTSQKEKLPSFHAQLSVHTIHALIAFRRVDGAVIYNNYKAILELWESHPHFLKEEIDAYRRALCNYLYGCYYLKKFEEYPDVIKKIKELPSTSKDIEAKIFQMAAYHETLLYLNGGTLYQAKDQLIELGIKLMDLADYINPGRFLSLCGNIMLIYFYLGEFKNAYRWSQELDNYKFQVRKEVRKLNQFFQLILLFELNKLEEIANHVRRVKRQLQQEKKLSPLEEIILQQMNKIGKLNAFDTVGIEDELTQLQAAMTQLKKEKPASENSGQIFRNYELWINHRLLGVPLAELLE